jgi:CheY-like chemotaxis protein
LKKNCLVLDLKLKYTENDGEELTAKLIENKPLDLMDTKMPVMNDINATSAVKSKFP